MRDLLSITTILGIAFLQESVSNDCTNYNADHNSDCTETHCSANAASPSDGVCLEDGHVDSDCCAMPGSGYCSYPYVYSMGDKCHDIGAYTTCCVPLDDVPGSYFLGPTGGTYDQAKSYCEEKGATIAKILNAEDQSRAKEACGSHSCWIGLVEIGGNQWTNAADQVWEWADGTTMEYTHWSSGEPQNHDGVDEKNAIMNCCWEYCDHDCNGGWFDAPDYHDSPRPLCSGENHDGDYGDHGHHGDYGNYCPWNAAKASDGVCLENGHVDTDCCAMPGTGSCAYRYEYTQGDRCTDTGAYTTCCLPYGSKEVNAGETENTINEYSNGVTVAVGVFSAINTALLVLFLLFGRCCRRKKEERNIEAQGLLFTHQNSSSQIESNDRRNNTITQNQLVPTRLPVAQIITGTQNSADHKPSQIAISGRDAMFRA